MNISSRFPTLSFKKEKNMILVRDVFQATYGKGDELVSLFKEFNEKFAHERPGYRILTDASGPFFTIVTEMEFESMAEWEGGMAEFFSKPEFGDWFARMTPFVENGRRDFYNIEA